jgi:hypothetical protein
VGHALGAIGFAKNDVPGEQRCDELPSRKILLATRERSRGMTRDAATAAHEVAIGGDDLVERGATRALEAVVRRLPLRLCTSSEEASAQNDPRKAFHHTTTKKSPMTRSIAYQVLPVNQSPEFRRAWR